MTLLLAVIEKGTIFMHAQIRSLKILDKIWDSQILVTLNDLMIKVWKIKVSCYKNVLVLSSSLCHSCPCSCQLVDLTYIYNSEQTHDKISELLQIIYYF